MNHLHSVTAGVNISNAAVDRIIDMYFKDGPPDAITFNFTVVVDSKDFDASKHLGALTRVSPCEQAFAILRAVVRDLGKGDVQTLGDINWVCDAYWKLLCVINVASILLTTPHIIASLFACLTVAPHVLDWCQCIVLCPRSLSVGNCVSF